MQRIGILIAVDAEAQAVLKDYELQFIKRPNGIWSSESYPFDLVVTGVGKVLTAHALMQLEYTGNYAWYWSLGTSGSLGTDPVGSQFLCTSFVEWDMDIRPLGFKRGVTAYEQMTNPVFESMQKESAEIIASALGLSYARSLSGDSFIADEELAQNLCREFGAGLPLLVDMECAAAAKLCMLRIKKPFCALRWVTDNANRESGNNWEHNVMHASHDFAGALKTVGNVIHSFT